jgi:uncharacterized membrane protein SirB2
MATIKLLHQLLAAVSIAGFVIRGLLMLADSPLLKTRPVRIAPHVVDTGLLAAALVLMFNIYQYPFVHGWLTAKVLGLLAYIVLGTLALRRGRTRRVRLAAFLAAIAVYAYIVAVAFTRSPWAGLVAA